MLNATEAKVGIVNGFTATRKLCVVLSAGRPLSDTFKVIGLVVAAEVTRGRQSRAAAVLLSCVSVTLAGPFNKLKVKV